MLGAQIRKLGEIVLLQLEAATGTISTVLTSKRLGVARHANNVSKVQGETSKLKYKGIKATREPCLRDIGRGI